MSFFPTFLALPILLGLRFLSDTQNSCSVSAFNGGRQCCRFQANNYMHHSINSVIAAGDTTKTTSKYIKCLPIEDIDDNGDLFPIPMLHDYNLTIANRRTILAQMVSTASILTLIPTPTNAATQKDFGSQLKQQHKENNDIWVTKRPTLLDDSNKDDIYTDEFFNLLTRFLVNYDDSLRSWWISQSEYVVNIEEIIDEQRENQFKSLDSSVRAAVYSRANVYNTGSMEGTNELLNDLLNEYSHEGPDATKQLCGIFALLSFDYQPSELIFSKMMIDSNATTETEKQEEPNQGSNLGRDDSVGINPPIVFPCDRKIITLPFGLQPKEVVTNDPSSPFQPEIENVIGTKAIPRFEAYTAGDDKTFLASLRRKMIDNKAIPLAPLVTREKVLDKSIYARFFLAGALASGSAHAALTPLDMVKTRIQTQPTKYSNNPIKASSIIYDEEGMKAFASGLGPTLIGYLIAGSFAFGCTEVFKRKCIEIYGPQFVISNPFFSVLGCGAAAVTIAAIAVSPFETARVAIVDDPLFAPGLFSSLKRISKDEGGIGGFYVGLPALLTKEVPFHATKFAVFDVVSTAIKKFVVDHNTDMDITLSSSVITIVSAMLAGIAAAIVSQPADALFTKCNTEQVLDDVTGIKRKFSPVEAFIDLVNNDDGSGAGLATLKSGLISRCLFGAILVALQFTFYNSLKDLFHVSSSDLSVFLDAFSGLSSSGGI